MDRQDFLDGLELDDQTIVNQEIETKRFFKDEAFVLDGNITLFFNISHCFRQIFLADASISKESRSGLQGTIASVNSSRPSGPSVQNIFALFCGPQKTAESPKN